MASLPDDRVADIKENVVRFQESCHFQTVERLIVGQQGQKFVTVRLNIQKDHLPSFTVFTPTTSIAQYECIR